MQLAETIALTHQERWDGSGYPQEFKGTAIPLVGRVVAVADVFDALTSERPYKRAWTVEEATQEIIAKNGILFDPELVIAFQEILPQFIAIKEEYSDAQEISVLHQMHEKLPPLETS